MQTASTHETIPEARRIVRAAAIHDLCGYGNCSLGIAMPVLSAAGIEVCAVPTAFLAAHTAFPVYSFFDTTPFLDEYFAVWDKIDIPLDGLYTGFLGSAEQIVKIRRFADKRPQLKKVIDPVMGDHGRVYKTYTPEMCSLMKELAKGADLLTPNMTEAAILLDEDYLGQNPDMETAEELLDRLLELGAENVVLKGIERGDGSIINAMKGRELPYEETIHPLRPHKLHGTGDLFASIIAAAYFQACPLPEAVSLAGYFIGKAIDISIAQPGFKDRGVSFEPLLREIAEGIEAIKPKG